MLAPYKLTSHSFLDASFVLCVRVMGASHKRLSSQLHLKSITRRIMISLICARVEGESTLEIRVSGET